MRDKPSRTGFPAIAKSEKPPKLIVPKDPVQIGQTADGQPIWFDPKDLIPTPDEELERWEKTLDSRQQAMIDAAARLVLSNACSFVQQTVLETARKSDQLDAAMQAGGLIAHIESEGYITIQDGLKTVVKKHGKVLREMTAVVPGRWQRVVEKRVNKMLAAEASRASTLN